MNIQESIENMNTSEYRENVKMWEYLQGEVLGEDPVWRNLPESADCTSLTCWYPGKYGNGTELYK